jgi:hypothetical protein
MIIFIDTNIIYGNWHLQKANFQYLLNYLENTKSTLAVSEIVCDEIDNKYYEEFNSLNLTLKNNLKKYESLINKSSNIRLEENKYEYSFKNILKNNSNKVAFYPFDLIPNKKIVARAIKKVKPFKDDDKGYRDTLIWLSFLEYLSTEKTEDIAFINNNSTDFYNVEKSDFHVDLLEDIKTIGLKNNFKVYESIKDFINAEVGQKHKYTADIIMETFLNPQKIIIEKNIELYINSQSSKWFTDILKGHSRAFEKLSYLITFNFSIIEGIEDPKLLNWAEIEENIFFGELRFFLKVVEIKLTIPKIIYNSNKDFFPKAKNIEETNNDYITLTIINKIYMNISFNFHKDKNTVENLEINMFGPL